MRQITNNLDSAWSNKALAYVTRQEQYCIKERFDAVIVFFDVAIIHDKGTGRGGPFLDFNFFFFFLALVI